MLNHLASSTSSADGQEAILNRPQYHDALARNPQLADEPWKQLWTTKPPVARAVHLSKSPAALRSGLVLTRDRRLAVLRSLLTSTTIPLEDAVTLLDSGRIDSETARKWWYAGTIPAGLEGRVARTAGGAPWGRFLLAFPDAPDAGDDEALAYIERFQGNSDSCPALLEARPQLLPLLLKSQIRSVVRMAFASRHMFDNTAMLAALNDPSLALADLGLLAAQLGLSPNAQEPVLTRVEQILTREVPMTPRGSRALDRIDAFRFGVDRPWEEVTSERELELLVHLSGSALGRHSAMAALGIVPPPTPVPRVVVTRPFPSRPVYPRETLLETPVNGTGNGPSVAQVADLLSQELDSLGPAAWQTAVMLLAEGFDEPAGVLLDVCRRL
jgi:hypothetical protein